MSVVPARSRRTSALAVPLNPVIGTDQLIPPLLVVGVPIVPPVVPTNGNEKSSLVTFATASLNVTRYDTLVPFVNCEVVRLIEVSDGAVLTTNELKLAFAATEFPAMSLTVLAKPIVYVPWKLWSQSEPGEAIVYVTALPLAEKPVTVAP